MDKVNLRCRLFWQLWGQMPQEHGRRVINLVAVREGSLEEAIFAES